MQFTGFLNIDNEEFGCAAVVNCNYSYFFHYCLTWVMLICRSNPDLPLVQVRWRHTWGISAAWRKRLQLLYFYPPKLFSSLTLMCHRPWQWTTWMCGCVFVNLRTGRAVRTLSSLVPSGLLPWAFQWCVRNSLDLKLFNLGGVDFFAGALLTNTIGKLRD